MLRVLQLLLSGALLVGTGWSWAGVDEGLVAALKEFQPLAEQGSAQAQYYLNLIVDSNCLDILRRALSLSRFILQFLIMLYHRIQYHQKFAHTCDQCRFLGFARCHEPMVEGFGHRVVTAANQCRHVL